MNSNRPLIAITMGDPCGVGPEIIVAALTNPAIRAACRPLVLGDRRAMQRALTVCNSELELVTVASPSEAADLSDNVIPLLELSNLADADISYGRPSELAGDAVYRYIRHAAELCLTGEVAAMATAPICKEAMHRAGHHYPGHTELLAELCRCDQFVMMLAGDILRVALVTIHEAIANVPGLISTEQVLKTIRVTATGVAPLCGCRSPRIAVLALNPHCGEGGMFGTEEQESIIPAITAAKAEGMDVSGPFSADTFFHFAVQEPAPYDAVVAMYHDQGLIPLKMRHFDDGINITLGLPIIRTSVDHGTAYNLAGTATASATSMKASIRIAAKLAAGR
ncbi:4-hydroxythreonine-4-phosphate dehydrogenase [Trichlorobacter thiogenes]|uniref:4-hydroxythreonine-4-phosphate dehydrogenase n=1 Tax=Trichlorobacter thiogenes TaxID=115783 RepID=A0A1T4JYI8_9BACT|nr:4-hydroxythreonine-4-phosphate dehydrogenase PdxA [Trichlorobacter thiogenes]SJZ35194.1 4-hydroxythreonine-4-phosphate dehydrogenase [Trichlorobacter thiogenes]